MVKNGESGKEIGFKKYATPRVIGGIAIAIVVLWLLTLIFGSSEKAPTKHAADVQHSTDEAPQAHDTSHQAKTATDTHASAKKASEHGDEHAGTAKSGSHGTVDTHTAKTGHASSDDHAAPDTHKTDPAHDDKAKPAAAGHDTKSDHQQDTHASARQTGHATTDQPTSSHAQPATAHADKQASDHATGSRAASGHETTTGHPLPDTTTHKPTPKGVAFVEASIKPLEFELEERWWGWRPNDLIDLTDNVNQFQLGVLEVTRRTTVALAERISRTGTTDAYDENLEAAMNWFMVKATSYWFPSAESKYRDGLEELEVYLEKLKAGRATFYTRTDNLIPLLASFEDLLGSCDENMVKQFNEDGTPISSFAVDNYFYYTKGVASSMATVLEAVHHDFLLTLESRHGTELLHHAIVSCQQAAELEPWIILNSDLSSIFANHRANMAAPVSHARFYLGQLIKTLST
jgi:hypothetical protein